MKPPYTVEPAGDNCGHCGREHYDIVGPDGVALGHSFSNRCDADEEAAELNRAFTRGVASNNGIAEAVLSAALEHGVTWDANSRTIGHDPSEGFAELEDALATTLVHLIDLPRSGT